jgi:hypothetical protein
MLVIYGLLFWLCVILGVYLVLDWLLEQREEGGLDLRRFRRSLATIYRRLWRRVILRLRV